MKKLFYLSLATFLFYSCKNTTEPSRDNNHGLFIPDDLEATVWAETPLFYNPTNMDIDARGRVWVTEAVNYRNFNNDSTKFLHHAKGDRVMILEDTNGDGKADTSKMFVQDTSLVSPLGIAVMGNKVIVSCAPSVIIYTDDNGDDVPDKKEVFLTGFGGLDHDHSLHAVLAGPDGNWYFNTGNAGPHFVKDKSGWMLRSGSVYTGGTPYNTENEGNLKSDDGKVWVGGLALEIKPDGTGLQVKGHNFRNAYELTMDSNGDMWQNDNDDGVAACRTTWLMEGGNAGFFSEDGTRSWQADQRPDQDIITAHWHQEDPGVIPYGDRSGAGAPTGIVLNEGDALGKQYRGLLLSADAGRNVIFGYKPERKESGYIPAQRSNFITSLTEDNTMYVWNDSASNTQKEKWFRPSDVAIGTDGAIYVADWYDPVVGGHQMQDQKGFGKIYRITPKNKKLTAPKIDLSTVDGQIKALKNPAINVRHLAFDKLKSQGDAVTDAVSKLLQDENPYIRSRAIWLLAQLGPKGISETEKLLKSTHEEFRIVAFRSLREVSKDILPYAIQLQNDPSSFVRREIAIALRDLPFEKTKPILIELIKQYDGEDRWYLEAIGAALKGHEEEVYAEIKPLLAANETPSKWNNKMVSFAWRLHPASSLNDLLVRATDSSLNAKERRSAIAAIAFMKDKKAAETMLALRSSKLADVSEQASYWLAYRKGNDWVKMLDWSKIKFNSAYEVKLATMKAQLLNILDDRIALVEKKWRLEEMARDSVGGQLLIGLASENKFPEALKPAMEQVIFKNPDMTVRVQAGKYFKQPGGDKIYSIQDIAAMQGNAEEGKGVFTKFCSSCHKVDQLGNSIGPELTTIGKKFDKTGLLDAILNPSAAIMGEFQPWLVNTKDGASYFGFITSENKQALIIKDAAGQSHTVAIDKISKKEKQSKSLMPEPAVTGVTEKQLADVAAFLMAGK